jgi:hypothetical protein
MFRHVAPLIRRVGLLCSSLLALSALAKTEEWTDAQGNSFKGEPMEVFGPFALFKVGYIGGRKLPLRFLTAEDCIRVYQQTKNTPPRAETWSKAQGDITQPLLDKVQRVQGDKLVNDNLQTQPEPEVILVFFSDNSVPKSWELLSQSITPFNDLKSRFPGQIEGLFFGLRHSLAEHEAMAVQNKIPWLVANYSEEYKLDRLIRFAPGQDQYGILAISREGVPLFAAPSPDNSDLKKFFTDLGNFLDLTKPSNPHGWADRAHYLRAVQPVIYAAGKCDPVLVGNPLVPEGLKKNHVSLVEADIAVGADGKVKSVALKNEQSLPAPIVAPLTEALKKACVFVAAVENGRFVDGTYAYRLEVAP